MGSAGITCALPLSFPNDVKQHLAQLTTYPDQGYVEAGFSRACQGPARVHWRCNFREVHTTQYVKYPAPIAPSNPILKANAMGSAGT